MFLEPSTRTQSSFELAGKRLSADVINIKGSSSSVSKGESLKDTILTLESYRPDIIVMRHPRVGASRMATRYTNASVVNAGDGTGEHPTQCLLDLYSLRRVYGELEGLKVAIVGDILRSRVARSDLFGFRKMGIDVRLVGPPTLMPPGIEYWDVPIYHDLDALEDVDVIYLLRMQLERAKGKVPPVPVAARVQPGVGSVALPGQAGPAGHAPGAHQPGRGTVGRPGRRRPLADPAPGGVGPGRAHGHPLPVPGR